MIGEWRIEKDLEGTDGGLVEALSRIVQNVPKKTPNPVRPDSQFPEWELNLAGAWIAYLVY